MTQSLIKVALYEPDIPQNTAAIMRLCACFGVGLDIIEPCGFFLNDKRFKRVVMDYIKMCKIKTFKDFREFKKDKKNERIILMTTRTKSKYYNFKFNQNDTLLFGRESAGVPQSIHQSVAYKLTIPMQKEARSLNIVSSVAITLAEALKQNKYL